jgi:hypothetical protein
MPLISSCSPIVGEFLRALGIKDLSRVAGVNLDIQPGQAVRLVVGFYVDELELERAAAIVKEKELYLASANGEKAVLSPLDAEQELRDIAHRLKKSTIKKAPA